MRKLCFAFLMLACGNGPGNAQTTTDVAQTVSKLLTAIGPVPYTTTVSYWTVCRSNCGTADKICFVPCQGTKTETISSALKASNIAIVSRTDVEFGLPMYTNYPNDLNANFATIRNCSPPPTPPSSQPQPPTQVTISTSITRTTSVTFSESITNGGSTSFGFTLGAQVEGVKGGITGNVSVTSSSTSGSATTNTDAAGITQTVTGTYTEPWMSTSLVGVSSYRIGITVPFGFTATVDADLSPNDRKLSRLSSVLTTVQRTFPIVGQIASDSASQAQITYYPPSALQASDCTEPGTTTNQISGGEVNPAQIVR